ncbi:MAG: biopolymer transporter ExbD [Verrucomicrobiota bacterium]
MNFRKRLSTEPIQFQLAPFVDVVMFLLTFFLLTWNITRYERDIDIKMPAAKHAEEPRKMPGEVIVNLRSNGEIILNRRSITQQELQEILTKIVEEFPDQAVTIRGDQGVEYKYVMRVLDACRGADLWNVAFATDSGDEVGSGGGGGS